MLRMGGRLTIPTAVAALFLSAAACSSSSADKAGPAATVGTEPVTTTTTSPYAVPAVIDAAYVNRVLAGLDAVVGDAVRIVVAARNLPPEALDRLRAVYAEDELLQLDIDGFQRDLRNGLSDYRPNPGNQVTIVAELINATPACIFSRVRRDYSLVGTNPLPGIGDAWVGLKPIDVSRDPNRYNPTPWAFVYDGFPKDRSRPPDPCAS